MNPPDWRDAHETNRRSWNAVTAAHNSHKRDQAQFLRDGGSTLFPEELELLGELSGQRLVHLQCNCGQDSLSLAAHGADVTGVDISDEAIAFARALSEQSGIAATFERADLFDWFARAESQSRFGLAFSSYGTIGWLADINQWAQGVANVLQPGGALVLLEFHPIAWCFDATGRVREPYFIDHPLDEGGVNDYVASSGKAITPSGWEPGVQDFVNPHRTFQYAWTVAQIVQAIADAGLRLDILREYPYSNACKLFDGMVERPARRFVMPNGVPNVPLMLGLRASKR